MEFQLLAVNCLRRELWMILSWKCLFLMNNININSRASYLLSSTSIPSSVGSGPESLLFERSSIFCSPKILASSEGILPLRSLFWSSRNPERGGIIKNALMKLKPNPKKQNASCVSKINPDKRMVAYNYCTVLHIIRT